MPQGEADIKRCPSKTNSNGDFCVSWGQPPTCGFTGTVMLTPTSTAANLSPKVGLLSAIPRLPPHSALCWARGSGCLGWAWMTTVGVTGRSRETMVAAGT